MADGTIGCGSRATLSPAWGRQGPRLAHSPCPAATISRTSSLPASGSPPTSASSAILGIPNPGSSPCRPSRDISPPWDTPRAGASSPCFRISNRAGLVSNRPICAIPTASPAWYWSWLSPSIGRSRPACGTTPTIPPLPKKTPGPPAGQARPRKTFLVHPWPPARHQAPPRMPPAPKALEMSDKLIDAQIVILAFWGPSGRNRELITATLLALCATILISGLLPALGPAHLYGIAIPAMQTAQDLHA